MKPGNERQTAEPEVITAERVTTPIQNRRARVHWSHGVFAGLLGGIGCLVLIVMALVYDSGSTAALFTLLMVLTGFGCAWQSLAQPQIVNGRPRRVLPMIGLAFNGVVGLLFLVSLLIFANRDRIQQAAVSFRETQIQQSRRRANELRKARQAQQEQEKWEAERQARIQQQRELAERRARELQRQARLADFSSGAAASLTTHEVVHFDSQVQTKLTPPQSLSIAWESLEGGNLAKLPLKCRELVYHSERDTIYALEANRLVAVQKTPSRTLLLTHELPIRFPAKQLTLTETGVVLRHGEQILVTDWDLQPRLGLPGKHFGQLSGSIGSPLLATWSPSIRERGQDPAHYIDTTLWLHQPPDSQLDSLPSMGRLDGPLESLTSFKHPLRPDSISVLGRASDRLVRFHSVANKLSWDSNPLSIPERAGQGSLFPISARCQGWITPGSNGIAQIEVFDLFESDAQGNGRLLASIPLRDFDRQLPLAVDNLTDRLYLKASRTRLLSWIPGTLPMTVWKFDERHPASDIKQLVAMDQGVAIGDGKDGWWWLSHGVLESNPTRVVATPPASLSTGAAAVPRSGLADTVAGPATSLPTADWLKTKPAQALSRALLLATPLGAPQSETGFRRWDLPEEFGSGLYLARQNQLLLFRKNFGLVTLAADDLQPISQTPWPDEGNSLRLKHMANQVMVSGGTSAKHVLLNSDTSRAIPFDTPGLWLDPAGVAYQRNDRDFRSHDLLTGKPLGTITLKQIQQQIRELGFPREITFNEKLRCFHRTDTGDLWFYLALKRELFRAKLDIEQPERLWKLESLGSLPAIPDRMQVAGHYLLTRSRSGSRNRLVVQDLNQAGKICFDGTGLSPVIWQDQIYFGAVKSRRATLHQFDLKSGQQRDYPLGRMTLYDDSLVPFPGGVYLASSKPCILRFDEVGDPRNESETK